MSAGILGIVTRIYDCHSLDLLLKTAVLCINNADYSGDAVINALGHLNQPIDRWTQHTFVIIFSTEVP